MQVFVRDNDVNSALRVLKKKLQREGTFREMKRRRSYEKPSERRGGGEAEGGRWRWRARASPCAGTRSLASIFHAGGGIRCVTLAASVRRRDGFQTELQSAACRAGPRQARQA